MEQGQEEEGTTTVTQFAQMYMNNKQANMMTTITNQQANMMTTITITEYNSIGTQTEFVREIEDRLPAERHRGYPQDVLR